MEQRAAMPRRQRRKTACRQCNAKKTGCSGGYPCRGCATAKPPMQCEYIFRDVKIKVPSSIIDGLEEENEQLKAELQELKASSSVIDGLEEENEQLKAAIQELRTQSLSTNQDHVPGHTNEPDVANPLLEIQDGLFAGQESSQPVFIGEASCTAFGDRLLHIFDESYSAISCNTMANHVTHPVFNRLLNPEFQLPNRNQATLLIGRADSFLGSNYHLFEKKTFFKKLERAYSGGGQQDLLYMCHLFSVLALGELYSNCTTTPGDSRVPGTSWFIQAVGLLQDLYEVASIEQVQIFMLLSFYANALGRVKSANVYCGIAVRLAIGLGLHRSQSGTSTMDPVQRESRRRVWWTLYLFDRMISSKLGYPLAIHDDDIDAEYPSMEGLTPNQQAEFSDPIHLCAHIQLAKISGDILSDVYCLPQHKRGTFVHRVHRVLNDLRQWDEELPNTLRLQGDNAPRNLYTLHMQYHLCIAQTTRPILLHLFKARFNDSGGDQRQVFSDATLALADACVHAARTTNYLLTRLFVHGSLAVFGYFDAHYTFSSTLILIISAVMDPSASISDAVQMAFSLLRAMSSNGNVSAQDYLYRLEHIRAKVSSVRDLEEQRHPGRLVPMMPDGNDLGPIIPLGPGLDDQFGGGAPLWGQGVEDFLFAADGRAALEEDLQFAIY